MDVIEYEFFDNGTVKVKKTHVEKKAVGFRKKKRGAKQSDKHSAAKRVTKVNPVH